MRVKNLLLSLPIIYAIAAIGVIFAVDCMNIFTDKSSIKTEIYRNGQIKLCLGFGYGPTTQRNGCGEALH
jgi:hypothetical protein